MMRKLASGVSVTLGLAAVSAQADEIAWRAVGDQAPKQPVPAPSMGKPTMAPSAAPSVLKPAVYRFQSGPGNAAGGSATLESAGWVRIRAQKDDESQPDAPVTLPVTELPSISTVLPDPKPKEAAPMPSAPQTNAEKVGPAASDAPASSAVPSILPANPQSAQIMPETCMLPAESRAPRLQVTAEYLLWWAKSSQVPPLLTTSPPNGANGIPGTVPGSTVLIGGEDLETTTRNGGRFGLVWWFDDCASYGFDGRYFFTGETLKRISVSSLQPDGTDISLFRPFTAANSFVFGTATLPGPFREQVTAPGVASGTFTARSTSYLWGAEANYRDCLCWWCNCASSFRADMLVGFRYLHLNEEVRLSEDSIRLVPSVDFPDEIAGTRISLFDEFQTFNDFYGGQIGTVMTYTRDRWSLDFRGTVALGTTHQILTIDGGQVRSPLAGGGAFVAQGGLLALPTNIGEFSRNVLSVVPEIGINLGFQVTDHWKAFVGYNFLYWSNVIRPGDQIDTVVDVTRVPRFVPPGLNVLPDGPRPAAAFHSTDFWVQGVNFGAEYRW